MTWIIVLAVVAGVGIIIYNGLVKLRVQVDGAWADVDVLSPDEVE